MAANGNLSRTHWGHQPLARSCQNPALAIANVEIREAFEVEGADR